MSFRGGGSYRKKYKPHTHRGDENYRSCYCEDESYGSCYRDGCYDDYRPYQSRAASKPRLASRAGAAATTAAAAGAAAASTVRIYTDIKNVVATSQQEESERRRWWLWLLIPLLIVLGYECYQCIDIKKIKEILPQSTQIEPVFADTYKPPQNNLIQIFNINKENGEAVAARLKGYFDKLYVSKDQMNILSQEIHMRLIDSVKPDTDEDRIRGIVQEYLVMFERRQMEILVEKVKEYVKEIQIERVETGLEVEDVKRIVAEMLKVYDADKTGLVDYAMESAGGQILSTRCTKLYNIKTKQYSILGLPVWRVYYMSPRYALAPGAMPGECWAFQGFPGYLVVRTYAIIEVTGFSLEHMSRLLASDGKIESAPRNFSVYGLRNENDPEPHLFGNYIYDSNGTSIQHFPVKHPKTQDIGGVKYPVAHYIIELKVESNYGNPTYTCVYRFRVHGNPPLSDVC